MRNAHRLRIRRIGLPAAIDPRCGTLAMQTGSHYANLAIKIQLSYKDEMSSGGVRAGAGGMEWKMVADFTDKSQNFVMGQQQ